MEPLLQLLVALTVVFIGVQTAITCAKKIGIWPIFIELQKIAWAIIRLAWWLIRLCVRVIALLAAHGCIYIGNHHCIHRSSAQRNWYILGLNLRGNAEWIPRW